MSYRAIRIVGVGPCHAREVRYDIQPCAQTGWEHYWVIWVEVVYDARAPGGTVSAVELPRYDDSLEDAQGFVSIGKSVRPGNAGRRGVKRRELHETSFVVQQVRTLPGQG